MATVASELDRNERNQYCFTTAEFTFPYLRRNPNDPPDNNLGGYNFWLDKLNQFNGGYIAAEMV